MSKLARKIRRKKLKELRKDTRKKLRHVEESINNMPNECSSCAKEFDNSESDSWTIKMSLEGAKLICPDCMEVSHESEN